MKIVNKTNFEKSVPPGGEIIAKQNFYLATYQKSCDHYSNYGKNFLHNIPCYVYIVMSFTFLWFEKLTAMCFDPIEKNCGFRRKMHFGHAWFRLHCGAFSKVFVWVVRNITHHWKSGLWYYDFVEKFHKIVRNWGKLGRICLAGTS